MKGRNTLFSLRLGGRPCGLSHAGFSMIELLIVIAVLAILFTFIYKGFERLNRYYTAENVKAATQQSARIGVEMMLQDIRLAGLNPLGTAGAGVVAATPTSLHFTADANFDGDVADPFEDITYGLNLDGTCGTCLQQTNHLGTETLLGDVSALGFRYFDTNDDLIPFPIDDAAELAAIRTVEISLSLNRPAGREGSVSRAYTTRVRCRNL